MPWFVYISMLTGYLKKFLLDFDNVGSICSCPDRSDHRWAPYVPQETSPLRSKLSVVKWIHAIVAEVPNLTRKHIRIGKSIRHLGWVPGPKNVSPLRSTLAVVRSG